MQSRTIADVKYVQLLKDITRDGQIIDGRNSRVLRLTMPATMTFTEFPLVTVRKTAVKMALKEWEWFCSGSKVCPPELAPWWDKQLTDMIYEDGYPAQMRHSSAGTASGMFDQLNYLIKSLIFAPFSRRHVISLWNTGDMDNIQNANNNPNCPPTCHGTLIQCFVNKDGTLDMLSYQRSADVILGLPHNLVQYWAFLKYLATHTGWTMGKLKYQLGDAHIYEAEGHLEATAEMIQCMREPVDSYVSPHLAYFPSDKVDIRGVPVFKASEFQVTDTEDVQPAVTIKPKLVD